MRFFLSVFILFSFIFFLLSYFFRFNERDIEEYQHLMLRFDSTYKGSKVEPYQVKQQRSQVQKELVFTKENQQLKFRLNAADSQLVLDQVEKMEIVEEMHDVRCVMQEELYYLLPDGRQAYLQNNGKLLIQGQDPNLESSWLEQDTQGIKAMEIVRYFIADSAEYSHKSNLLIAQKVQLYRFAVEGHDIDGHDWKAIKPLMQGNADQMEISLTEKNLRFQAKRLKANFDFSLLK